MSILAAHQPSFIPFLSYFDKMNKADIFVLMVNCQFEKNSWTNRCQVWDKYWTMPVRKGNRDIKEKVYVNGTKLVTVNEQWIYAIALTLGIDTSKFRYDFPTDKRGTARIIELCRHYGCDRYLTNPEAMDKYLDERAMNDAGVEVLKHSFPSRNHVFEAFSLLGIEGTQKLLQKEKVRCGA